MLRDTRIPVDLTNLDATNVNIADAGDIITATDVEGALQENRTAINLNTTHRSSDGSDHTYIDQDVTSGSSPTFDGANLTGVDHGDLDGIADDDHTQYVLADASRDITGDQNITGTLEVTGTGDNARTITVGSGEGALRFHHDNTGGDAKIQITPYYGGEWSTDNEYAFDANTGEWMLQGNILRAPEIYYVDPTVNDQGGNANGSFKNLISALNVTSNATIIFPSTNGTTEYEFNTSFDASAWESLNFQWQEGAVFTQKTGDETVTFYKATQLQFEERQLIGPIDMFVFDQDIMRYSTVEVFPWVSSSVSNVRVPSGLWLDISASTTQGLQEAITYSFGDGTPGTASYNLTICGKQDPGGGAISFTISDTLQFPAMRQTVLKTGGFTLTPAGSVVPMIQFDSMFQCKIELNCEIDQSGDGEIVLFYPENIPPGAGLVGILESEITMGTIAYTSNPSSPTPMIAIDGSNGYCGTTDYIIREINGNSHSNAIGIKLRNADYWMYNNKIIANHIHACATGLVVGEGTVNDLTYLVNNIFEIGIYNYATGLGIDVNSCNNTYFAHSFFDYNDGYTIRLTTDVHWKTNATGNMLICPHITSIIDDSDGSNRIISSSYDTINIDNLNNINITDVQDRDILYYDSTSEQWINAINAAATLISDSTNNKIARYDGTDNIQGSTAEIDDDGNLIINGNLDVSGDTNLDGAVTINESGADKDFRVEASGEANALFIQGSDGSIGISESSPNASALLHMTSTSKGFLPPVMTGAQVEAIGSPTAGLLVYATNAGSGDVTGLGWWGWNGSNWIQLG